jgi:hypothetical protein
MGLILSGAIISADERSATTARGARVRRVKIPRDRERVRRKLFGARDDGPACSACGSPVGRPLLPFTPSLVPFSLLGRRWSRRRGWWRRRRGQGRRRHGHTCV